MDDTNTTNIDMADDASDSTWILSSTIFIFSMQAGFGLLESGSVSTKNEANIMVKNAVDVIFGGLTFWAFGYGFAFGEEGNPFCGWGNFFVKASKENLGWVYSKFFFQASFATTATTIVSGSMAERTKLEAYMVFSMLNTLIFCLPAHWVWASDGWLRKLGVVDIAGAGPVHLVGGVTGLVATLMLKPRHNRFKEPAAVTAMGSPTNAILGMFMLWWGWLGFNCGSTFGISGVKWVLAARSAVSTITASVAGGIVGLAMSYIMKDRRFDISYLINGVLGSLVGITANCALAEPWEGFLIGFVGAFIANLTVELFSKLHIDDPVGDIMMGATCGAGDAHSSGTPYLAFGFCEGCVGTHACAGIWSLLSAGLITKADNLADAMQLENVHEGVFHGGDMYQLGIQSLAVVTITGWTVCNAFIWLKIIDLTIGIRVPLEEEILGADIVEHAVGGVIYNKRHKKFNSTSDTAPPTGDDDEKTAEFIRDKVQSRRHSLGRHVGRVHGRYERKATVSKSETRRGRFGVSRLFNRSSTDIRRKDRQTKVIIYSVCGDACTWTNGSPDSHPYCFGESCTWTNGRPDIHPCCFEETCTSRTQDRENDTTKGHNSAIGIDLSRPRNKLVTYL